MKKITFIPFLLFALFVLPLNAQKVGSVSSQVIRIKEPKVHRPLKPVTYISATLGYPLHIEPSWDVYDGDYQFQLMCGRHIPIKNSRFYYGFEGGFASHQSIVGDGYYSGNTYTAESYGIYISPILVGWQPDLRSIDLAFELGLDISYDFFGNEHWKDVTKEFGAGIHYGMGIWTGKVYIGARADLSLDNFKQEAYLEGIPFCVGINLKYAF